MIDYGRCTWCTMALLSSLAWVACGLEPNPNFGFEGGGRAAWIDDGYVSRPPLVWRDREGDQPLPVSGSTVTQVLSAPGQSPRYEVEALSVGLGDRHELLEFEVGSSNPGADGAHAAFQLQYRRYLGEPWADINVPGVPLGYWRSVHIVRAPDFRLTGNRLVTGSWTSSASDEQLDRAGELREGALVKAEAVAIPCVDCELRVGVIPIGETGTIDASEFSATFRYRAR